MEILDSKQFKNKAVLFGGENRFVFSLQSI